MDLALKVCVCVCVYVCVCVIYDNLQVMDTATVFILMIQNLESSSLRGSPVRCAQRACMNVFFSHRGPGSMIPMTGKIAEQTTPLVILISDLILTLEHYICRKGDLQETARQNNNF